jgi:hypothetical protein
MKWRTLFLLSFLGSSAAGLAADSKAVADATLFDLRGKQVAYSRLVDGSGTVVLVAVATKCPVVRKVLPELNALRKKWDARGVRFYLVDPASYDTEAGLKKELAQFGNRIPAYVDRARIVARAWDLNVTAKAVVLHEGRLVYAGAIDDRFTFDGARPGAQKHFLEEVLSAVSQNHPVPYRERAPQAAGCAIALD